MDCIKKKVKEEVERGCIGSNLDCPYYPSHFIGQDCTFCYCPFYPCHDETLGEWVDSSSTGEKIWACTNCLLLHKQDVAAYLKKNPDATLEELKSFEKQIK